MIIRIWRGRATVENAAAYAHHATETVFPALADLPSFRGAQLLQREIAGGIEFLVLTDWESLDAIRAFAGDDADTAVVEPTAGAILSEFDPSVRHYERVHDTIVPG